MTAGILVAILAFNQPILHNSAPRRPSRAASAVMNSNADILKTLKELEAEQKELAALKKEREKAEATMRRQAETKVNTFGARLDDDVAGQEMVVGDVKRLTVKEEYERLFDQGNQLMLRGEYKLAVKAFTQAVVNAPGGMTGRKGGQYSIYLAQALQADQRRNEAVKLLQTCEAHSDGDVRKIAESVLYIMQAPELKLDADQFISIGPMPEVDTWGAGRRVKEDKDPPPEKYSLEWYVLEAEARKGRDDDEPVSVTPALVAIGVILIATFTSIAS